MTKKKYSNYLRISLFLLNMMFFSKLYPSYLTGCDLMMTENRFSVFFHAGAFENYTAVIKGSTEIKPDYIAAGSLTYIDYGDWTETEKDGAAYRILTTNHAGSFFVSGGGGIRRSFGTVLLWTELEYLYRISGYSLNFSPGLYYQYQNMDWTAALLFSSDFSSISFSGLIRRNIYLPGILLIAGTEWDYRHFWRFQPFTGLMDQQRNLEMIVSRRLSFFGNEGVWSFRVRKLKQPLIWEIGMDVYEWLGTSFSVGLSVPVGKNL